MSRKAVLERTLGKKAAKRFLPKVTQELKLELSCELVEQVMQVELRSIHGSLTKDLKARKAGKGIAIFDPDKDRDIAEISNHLNAIETVSRYYGVSLK
jgi:hypothetical protein